MGDRVLVTFIDSSKEYTPAIYMHWGGSEAADLIKSAATKLRKDDASYAAARFCGECHLTTRDRTTGLGRMPAPEAKEDGEIDWQDYSHGDAGVYVVNMETGEVEAHAGYGEPFTIDPATFSNA